MSDQTGPNLPYNMYAFNNQGFTMPGATAQQQFPSQNMNQTIHGPLSNMQNLKAALPGSAADTINYTKSNRSTHHVPVMVMPTGETVPLSSFNAQTGGNNGNGIGYMQHGLMPGFVGNPGLTAGPMTQYSWPFGMTAPNADLDASRRGNWSVNDENMPDNALHGPGVQADFYGGYQFTHPATTATHYTAGPVQPMKTADNKNYDMINLDELTQRDPPIPRAVPALWTNQEDMTLAKCLQNPEGITNVYIRGFMPDTTDEDLHGWASRFGEIESCKAIIDQDTGSCKGFGFVMYYSPAAAENCIRGFFHLGFQASYAQKSRNSRLKDLEDRTSTNIYCTGVPIDWNESDLAKHFLPYNAVSTKICRDSPSGVSKEVGFARFESREVAERVVKEYHSTLVEHDSIKLYLRFADTKAQKQLKQQSQERRQWRSREYSYSVEHTPSPVTGRLQSMSHISPSGSYHSPAGISSNFTPATSVSPPEILNANSKVTGSRNTTWPTSGGLQSITNQKTRVQSVSAPPDNTGGEDTVGATRSIKSTSLTVRATKTPSPKKVTIKIEPASGKENVTTTPPSAR